MSRERLPMRKIRDVLRLHADKLSKRQIAVSLRLGRTAVGDYIKRATRAGLSWPLPAGLGDEDLERLLFPALRVRSPDRRPCPDWPALHRELRKPGVTLSLLWEEYRALHPEGYGYSRFCDLYRAWRGTLNLTMRQAHLAGEKMFVDYAGATAEVIDPLTGEIHQAQVFVAALGASSYSYAEATWTQSLPDWIASHCRAFAFFGGVPAQVVPDNLKSGVVKACLYDPEINRTFADMASHYATAIVPARPRKPRDKAKVEVAVQVVERWILARLRNRRFFSLAELNQAMAALLDDLNRRVTRHLGASRRQLFEELDRPALKPLPAEPYEYAEWKQRKAGLDYHVEVAKHYYSVPHALAKHKLWARITDKSVEVFHKGKRVACHLRAPGNRRHTTIPEHMPSSHRRYAGWTHERICNQASTTGPNTAALVQIILKSKPHPEQGFRSCVGILRLAKAHDAPRLEAACERALEIGARSYSSVASILKNNLDRRRPGQSAKGTTDHRPAIDHANIRGSGYFH
ncbi:MAG: IS21 family transposase [Rhodospirillales bacterium]|nr:IS21 family transposase [Rhodospirillales bacterium]MDH3792510.1 IS21 family transposase [Rhodospirillales bacterium]MDH3913750.1 IS21 family transposase [Rhodospirillales bacterium]MDH3920030.1 IS21 family transposase [Rhodospirillales bacterium]MDH3970107.1 IS21 family transposase [Rhodospirillales bacterium]